VRPLGVMTYDPDQNSYYFTIQYKQAVYREWSEAAKASISFDYEGEVVEIEYYLDPDAEEPVNELGFPGE
jgi:hypothetical protein